MVAPDVVDGGEPDTDPTPEDIDDQPQSATDDEVDIAMATVDDVGDPDGYFDGVETETGGTTNDSPFDDIDDSQDNNKSGGQSSPDSIGDIAERGGMLASNINNGFARAAVIGIENEQEKQSLYQEFQETFSTFQLGYYGEQVVHEYLDPDMEDIHPVAGLVGAMLLCSAVVIYKRPDGDDLIQTARHKVFGDDDEFDDYEEGVEYEFDLEDYRPPERPSEQDEEPTESDANTDADTQETTA